MERDGRGGKGEGNKNNFSCRNGERRNKRRKRPVAVACIAAIQMPERVAIPQGQKRSPQAPRTGRGVAMGWDGSRPLQDPAPDSRWEESDARCCGLMATRGGADTIV